MLDWARHDTILLDMDGTVLDLAFDNYFWREAVPRSLALANGAAAATVRTQLFERFAAIEGTLAWYCLDHWTADLGLDLRALKAASSHRIGFLPGARAFLAAVAGSDRRVALVTNAHRDTLQLKRGVAGLDHFFEIFVTSHDIGHPKEDDDFWPALQARLGFDPGRTLFVDDSPAVLDAAARFGIGTVVGIRRPDSRLPARAPGPHAAVDHLAELLPATGARQSA